jgi:large subunit ribosomal protein L13
MRTYAAKPGELEKKWVLIDASGLVVGGRGAHHSPPHRGHHKTPTPHVDTGDNVIVINAEKVVFTGRKRDDKLYQWHTGHPGGLKTRTPRMIFDGKFPERILQKAVERMLKRGPLQRKLMRNLKVYKGAEHPHDAQKPEPLDVKALNSKNAARA